MDIDLFRIISPADLPDYREQANDIAAACWPEFMHHDPIAGEYWHHLFDRFEEYQFAVIDTEFNRMAAIGNSLAFHWNQPFEDLPDHGWDWVFLTAINQHRSGVQPNMQSAIQIAIHPDYQSQGLSTRMVRAMGNIGRSKGFKHLIAPVRPNQKSKYPLIGIDDYVTWRTDDGLPFDAWLRVHARVGGRIIKPCHEAMIIKGTISEWEAWTGLEFKQSGEYAVSGALNPIKMNTEKDEGIYVEPNVWMVHNL